MSRDRLAAVLRRCTTAPLLALIWCYQHLISPMTPPTCRFYPSCSTYAATALRRFGLIRGTWLTVRRLGRCNPWNPGGVDHVPNREDRSAPQDSGDQQEPANRHDQLSSLNSHRLNSQPLNSPSPNPYSLSGNPHS